MSCHRESRLLRHAWENHLNAPWSTAAGRLFDAAAALVLGIVRTSYEAQGPMQLEAIAAPAAEVPALPMTLDAGGLLRVDWAPLIDVLCDATRSAAERAGYFHDALARTILLIAERRTRAARRLRGGSDRRCVPEPAPHRVGAGGSSSSAGFRVHLAEALPCNDAGIAFGQIVEAVAAGVAR